MGLNVIPRAAMAALAGVSFCALAAPAFAFSDTAVAAADTTPGQDDAAPAAAPASEVESPGDASHKLVPFRNGGRLLLTGGVSTIEGAGGGGLVPWALIGGYGTRDGWASRPMSPA